MESILQRMGSYNATFVFEGLRTVADFSLELAFDFNEHILKCLKIMDFFFK